MQAIISPHKYLKYGILALATLLLVFIGVFTMRPVHAQGSAGQHIITVHDDGVDKGFVTSSSTVREALKDGDIRLDASDRTEPGLDEKLVASSYQVNIYRARPVLVRDGASELTIVTSYRTGQQIAKEAGITLHDEDTTTLTSSTDPISDGAVEVMTIKRATPFTFVFYGKTEPAYSQATTVGEMLIEKGIKMTTDDELSISASAALVPGMSIALWRNGVQTLTQDEDITYQTEQVKDSDHEVGYKATTTVGEKGRRTATYRINVQNGVEVSREEVNSIVLKAAVTQVDVIGTKVSLPAGSHEDWMAAAGISSGDYGYVNYIVSHEDFSWEPCKVQGGAVDCTYSGNMGYGLVQATPGSKMVSAGSDWRTNPITQLRWATGYAIGRYGSWQVAYEHWVSHHNW